MSLFTQASYVLVDYPLVLPQLRQDLSDLIQSCRIILQRQRLTYESLRYGRAILELSQEFLFALTEQVGRPKKAFEIRQTRDSVEPSCLCNGVDHIFSAKFFAVDSKPCPNHLCRVESAFLDCCSHHGP